MAVNSGSVPEPENYPQLVLAKVQGALLFNSDESADSITYQNAE